MSHMRAMDVPFHMGYGGLICSKRLQSDRPKCSASMPDPRNDQNMITKYLSVGLWSWFSGQQVALRSLFQMRYDRPPNSEKRPVGGLRGWGTRNSSTPQYIRLWSVTLQLVVANQATIPHMKGEIHSYYMRCDSLLLTKRLQRYGFWNSLNRSSLV